MKNLLFFNKEGYPHNFDYNETDEKWEGKIIFDENGSETFKTQSLYIFENVDPINFAATSNLLKLTYFNYSGITFTKNTGFKNESIINISKINESSDFYSKWIYGTDFDRKFPKGSIIVFSGVTGSTITTDFDDDLYFTVVENKRNAIMIITQTNNSVFNFTFSSGTISESLNIISINDYNRNLQSEDFFQNLYTGKKLSIINTTLNDSIVSITKTGSTQTYSYINEIKITGKTNDIITLRTEFLTERPKIYQGDVILSKNGSVTQIMFNKITSSFQIGDEITFEDETTGTQSLYGYTFTIDEIVDRSLLGTKPLTFIKMSGVSYSDPRRNIIIDYLITFPGQIGNFSLGDVLILSAVTMNNTVLHNNREISVMDSSYASGVTTLRIRGYVIDETAGNVYKIFRKYTGRQIRWINVTPSGTVTNPSYTRFNNVTCYTTRTTTDLSQTILSETGATYFNTINSFIGKYRGILNNYGIEVYYSEKNNNGYLSVESLYGFYKPYFYVSGLTFNGTTTNNLVSDFSTTSHSLSSGLTYRYDLLVNKDLNNEIHFKNDLAKLSKNASAEILMNLNFNTSKFGFRLTLNSNQYFIQFTGDTKTTINSFIDTFGTVLYNSGFIINSGYSLQYTGYTLNISGQNPDVNIWNLEVAVNILSTYQIIKHDENRGILLAGNEIKSLDTHFFDVGLSTGMIINVSGSSFNDNNKEYNIIGLTDDTIQLSYQGSFLTEYNRPLIATSRSFLRKPRSSYNKDIYFKVTNNNPIDKTIFFYDITGTQLTPYNNIDNLKYTGVLPLIDPVLNNIVFLNKEPNKDILRTNNPKYQQTVFDELNFKLEQLDSSLDFDWIPEPLEIFIGYNSKIEGINQNNFKIEKIENFENTNIQINYSGYTTQGLAQTNNFYWNNNILTYESPTFNFINYGFEIDQLVSFSFIDQIITGQTIFENNDIYRIIDISRNKLTLDKTGVTFYTTGSTYKFNILIEPKEILNVTIFGETEIEDIRFKINLNNVGVQLEEDVAQIFKDTDIEDNATDFIILNNKRKEMLTDFREIYDFIGSYKGLINAINFFGYTDLELFEYYKNIDKSSPLYGKLHKVWIPDIFDNTVQGWNEIDFIAGKFQNQNSWKKTNLFNLTYKITDEDGNDILTYTLDEIQYKLTKLKSWLRKNIIPISSNLIDITGVADTTHDLWQEWDESNQTKKSVVNRNSTVVNFNYTATLNFGTNYLISINWYILSGATGTTLDVSDMPNFFTAKVKTFFLSGDTMIPVQYFKLRKSDLYPFSFNIDKSVDPYIYIETTTYDNDGSGIGFTNNKLFYYDEPRNHWLVNHNFDMSKFKYWQTKDFVVNSNLVPNSSTVKVYSTFIDSNVETNVVVNTADKTYSSNVNINNNSNQN